MARRRLGFWRRLAIVLAKPALLLLTRRVWRGAEHLPAAGGVIVVANHVSHADPLITGHFVYEAGRWPCFLGKASLFRMPLVGLLLSRVGQIPVERGSVNAARSLEMLEAVVRAGGVVMIYPEGTTTREPDLWPMTGKTGAARLALATGAPVVPLAIWGPQRIFDPRTGALRLRPRTPVTVVAGPPIDLGGRCDGEPSKETLAEMTDKIMLRVRDMLAEIRAETPPPLYPRRRRPAGASPVVDVTPLEGAA
ncbi:lysophospholipid acyltransferase family protein [Pilimelia columellifera]|uniref:Lysophospholipid acyltransferase family protein n=1 Tax=Pilimelia columellifera subsp. columellifera TaxID=706583 RepID=A0ABP6AC69_9ACTN